MSLALLRRGLATGWKSLLITAAAVAAMLALGLAVYENIDLRVYANLPEAVRALIGIPVGADAAVLAYSEMLASVGALAFVGVAIAIGAQAVAGEEQSRTLHLILAAPVSRARYIASRASAMALLIVAAGALLWAVAAAAPVLAGVEVGETHLAALMVHLTAVAFLHASLALAIGAASGRRGAAAGIASAVMVLGWLGSSLLPLWRADAADGIPWYWFNGSAPLVNGIDAGHLLLLLGGAVVLIGLGMLGFRARELRAAQPATGLLSRLRVLPLIGTLLAPTGRGTTPLRLRIAAQRTLLSFIALIMLVLGLVLPPIYGPLSAAIGPLAESFPPAVAALFGGGDLHSAAGFLHLELFGMLAPAAVIVVAIVTASAGITGEEQSRRMSLLLAQPVSRSRVYGTATAAMVLDVLIVGVALLLGSWVGITISGSPLPVRHLIAVCVLLILLGWFFGGLTLLCSGLTGSATIATWIPAVIAVGAFFGCTLLLAAGHEAWAWWSPFRAYLAGPPLMAGFDGWWQIIWLLTGAALFTATGMPCFRNRDLRITA
ncbi:ABC transporter permease subunit [Microbacterium soli]|uniref:Polyketide antibiotic transporter n=1 Tax=Microbacterium soli TaxID=446075 RepID=A0ABP7N069_9MICO